MNREGNFFHETVDAPVHKFAEMVPRIMHACSFFKVETSTQNPTMTKEKSNPFMSPKEEYVLSTGAL